MREEQRQEALRLSREEHHAEATLPPASAAPAPREEEQPPQVQEYRAEPEPRQVEAPRAEEPRVDPKVLLESAGLVMIETSKAPPAQAQPEEPQHLGRPRRERPKAETPQDAELVQIETSRK